MKTKNENNKTMKAKEIRNGSFIRVQGKRVKVVEAEEIGSVVVVILADGTELEFDVNEEISK